MVKEGHAGKIMERRKDKNKQLRCEYRFCQGALGFVIKYITKRILYVNLSDTIRFLMEGFLALPQKPKETGQENEDKVMPDISKADDVTDQKNASTGTPMEVDQNAGTPMEINQNTGTPMEIDHKSSVRNAETPKKVKPDGEQRRRCPILVSDTALLEQLEDFEDGSAILMLRASDAQALGFPLSTEAQGVLGIPSAPELFLKLQRLSSWKSIRLSN
ncbi:hypothetical protein BSKO_05823 [Bryopsis sp. KO-2023]|nr:hypothetical protein BSKO_05823 [Bryopsis sp. KO-2023]